MNTQYPRINPEPCSPRQASKKLLGVLLLFAFTLLYAQPVLSAVAFRSAASASAVSNITHVGTGTAASISGSNVTPTLPAGIQANDLLLCLVESHDTVAHSITAGWTTLYSLTGTAQRASLFYKIATASESNPTITHSGGNSIIARCVAFRGQDPITPFDVAYAAQYSTSDLTVETGSLTTVSSGDLILFPAHIANNPGSLAVTTAGGLTWTQSFYSATNAGLDSAIGLFYANQPAPAALGPLQATANNQAGESHGALLTLRSTSSLTINKPTGTITDDVMIAAITTTPSTVIISAPAGWILIRQVTQSSATSSVLSTYYKVVSASEPANYTWTFSSGAQAGPIGGIASFSGVDTTAPIDAEFGNATASSLTHVAPSITTTLANDMLVTVHEFSSASPWTPPAGMTEAIDLASQATPDANGVSMELNYEARPISGATGTRSASATANADTGTTQSVALKTSLLTCFTDDFNRTDGAPAGSWSVTNENGTFGNPRIVSQRLRLTDASTNASTMAALQQLFPAAGNKIVVEFDHYAYSGTGADGMCVVLSDASIAPVPGAFGGSLGYAPKQTSAGGDTTHAGFAGGWLGVALDEYGNFSNPTEGRIGGPGFRIDSAAIRGSGSLYTGYTYLTGTATLAPGIDNAGSATPAPGYRYRITIDHTDNTHAYTSVERDTGAGYTTIIPSFDAKAAAGQAAVPANWFLSFTGSTGAAYNIHDLDNLRVCSTQQQPLPTLNHVRILHDGQALTCAAENISLKACADASCSTLFLGPVTVTLSPASGVTWSSNPITFSGGQTTVTLRKTTAGTVTLGGIVTSPTATNATAVCYNGAIQSCSLTYTATSACFDAVETGRDASSPIYTKLAGTAFSLDVLALAAGFTGPVSVALVDPTATSGNCTDLNTGLTTDSSPYSFAAGDNGRHSFNFNYPNAAKNVKVRIRNTASNPNQVICSSDNFAIRPKQLTLANTTPLSPASNKLKAGANFGLTATSEVTGYTGTPTIDSTKIVDHNSTPIGAGTLLGFFGAATGQIATGTTFQYLDVGTITLNTDSVFDATFTAVDEVTGLIGGVNHGTGGDCITNSTSDTALVNFYGCNIGGTALGPLGRFYPDHYEVTATLAAACNGFTYMNQSALGVNLAIQAMASAGATPLSRFTSGYALFLRSFSVTGDNNGTTFDPLNNRLSPALPAFTWNAGAYSGSGTYSFNRAANPDGPYDNFKLNVTVTDPDGAQITKLNGAAITGASSVISPLSPATGTKIRYGRLRLPNAYGPETAPLIMALRAEYYNGTGFVTNSLDNCTNLPLATRIFLNNQATAGGTEQPGTTAMTIGTGATSAAMAHSPFVSGDAGLSFSSPGSSNVGFVDIRVDVSAYPWLQIDWDNNGSLDTDLHSRANFGIYRGNDRIINWREIIR